VKYSIWSAVRPQSVEFCHNYRFVTWTFTYLSPELIVWNTWKKSTEGTADPGSPGRGRAPRELADPGLPGRGITWWKKKTEVTGRPRFTWWRKRTEVTG